MVEQSRLRIKPCNLKEANEYVNRHHRHHGEKTGHKFSLSVVDDAGKIRGYAIVGRPVSRYLDDDWTAEVGRLVTDGCPNACSALYGAAWRSCKAMGYLRCITYILETEPGTSLRAAGWRLDGKTPGKSWNTPSRERTDKCELVPRQRWVVGQPFDKATHMELFESLKEEQC